VLGDIYKEEKIPIRIVVTEMNLPMKPPPVASLLPITITPYLYDEFQARAAFSVKPEFSITIKASKGKILDLFKLALSFFLI